MNNWHLNIPKQIHFYWSGKMPYLRYLSALSFKRLNPDWKIILWTSEVKSQIRTWNTCELNYEQNWDDYSEIFMGLCDKINTVDFSKNNDISEVHKSDLLRCWVLNKYGGVYSDTDIVYFNPISELSINNEGNQNVETFFCICDYGHSTGFLMASKGSEFFGRVFHEACKVDIVRYQSLGPDLFNKLFPTIESINGLNIGMDALYHYNIQRIDEIYKEKDLKFPKGAIGVHWYGGHPLSGNFLNTTNGGLNNLPDNIIGKLCKMSL